MAASSLAARDLQHRISRASTVAKLGDVVMSKSWVRVGNEVLAKLPCHDIVVIDHAEVSRRGISVKLGPGAQA